jgi:Domain of Unknown Function with PDB structure (DUF3857)/Transglutaminase-like superfamily
MKIRLLLLSLAIALAANVLARNIDDFRNATPEELAMKSAAMAPGAPAVILDWVQRSDDVNFQRSEYVRIKIFTDEGKKYGDVEIPYEPKYWDVRRLEARVTMPDGSIVPFNGKVYDKTLFKTGGTHVVSKTFGIPGLQPGCILEYRYDMTMRDKYVIPSRFTLQHTLPAIHVLVWERAYEKQFTSYFLFKGLPAGKHPTRIGDHFELELENVPGFEKERYAPPEKELKPWVNFFYIEGTVVDPTVYWSNHGQLLTSQIEKFIGKGGGAVAAEASAATTGAETSEAKLRKLYARTQRIRNLTFEDEKTSAEQANMKDNKSADDVLRNGYGTASEISRTFASLARAAGFDANEVRVGERDEAFFSQSLPVSTQLSGEVTQIVVDGKTLCLDAGTPGAPYGVVAWQKSHVPGLLITPRSKAAWVITPEEKASDAKLTRKAALRIENGTIKGKVTLTYEGQEALVKRVAHHNDDDAATRKALVESAKAWFPEAVITVTNVSGMSASEGPVVVEMDVDAPAIGSFAGSRALIPLSVFGASSKNPFAATTRKNAIYFSYAWNEEDDVTLDVPDGYSVESLPADTTYDVTTMAYTTHYRAEGKSLHFTRSFQVRSLYFPAASYSALRNFFSKATVADQEQIALKKRGVSSP